MNESETCVIYSILQDCRCRGPRCHCADDLDYHFPFADCTNVFPFCGSRCSLGLLACHTGNYELGLRILHSMSPEAAQRVKDCHNRTLIHMDWVAMVRWGPDGHRQRQDNVVELRQAQYARHVVQNLGVPIDTQIDLEYNTYQGQHPDDFGEHNWYNESYAPSRDDLGGYTSLMIAIKRRSFAIAGVLGGLGADWHTLRNPDGRTSYEMLQFIAPQEQLLAFTHYTATFGLPECVKRTVRSLLRLYKPVPA